MANRIRSLFEAVLFAGLKPSGGAPAQHPRRFAWLRDKLDGYLAGERSDDPLYLSNRTWKQKLKVWLVVGTPIAIILAGATLLFTNVLTPQARPPKEPTGEERLQNLLPDLQKTIHIDTVEGAEVSELRVLRDGPPRVTGVMTNNTDHALSVELDLELVDKSGSRLGSLTQRIENAQPHSSTRFEFAAEDPTTMYALVRKIRPAL